MTIKAPVEEVWPWLAQLGEDRAGFYSYCGSKPRGVRDGNADRIHPEWQHRQLGETVQLHPAGGLRVSVFEPGRALGLEGWGTFTLEHWAGETRLIARGGVRRGVGAAAYGVLMEIPHVLMERRRLLGISSNARKAAGRDASHACLLSRADGEGTLALAGGHPT